MTETILSSASKTICIGFEQPFAVIGERINPTGRKKLAAEMAEGNLERVRADALAQVEAGANMLDVNAGVPMADEAAIMREVVRLVQSLTDTPLVTDSSNPAALDAGLAAYEGRALVNSVTGEEESLEEVLPLVKKYGAAVVGISHDDDGISHDPDVRFAAARKIMERAMDHGIAACDVVIDPAVMPVGAVGDAGRSVLQVIRRVREELKLNMTCGASNVSFGLPDRHTLNGAFLSAAIGAGLTSAIMNPLHGDVMATIGASEVMLGLDPKCKRWIKRSRRLAKAAAAAEAAETGAAAE